MSGARAGQLSPVRVRLRPARQRNADPVQPDSSPRSRGEVRRAPSRHPYRLFPEELEALAASQRGYFTSRQAARFRFSSAMLAYRAGRDELEYSQYGIWRM